MGVSEEEFKIIVNYLDKNLSREDQISFEELMENSAPFRRELAESEYMIAGLKAINRVKRIKELKKFYKTIEETSQKPKRSLQVQMRWLTGIAAALALLIMGYLLYPGKEVNTEALYSQYYESFPVENTGLRNKDELAVRGLKLYQKGNYQLSIPFLNQLVVQYPDAVNTLYLSVAYMETQQFAEAEKVLTLAIQNDQDAVQKRYLYWYLSLSLMAQEKIPETVEQLKNLSQQEGVYREEANRLLEHLD